MSINISNCVLIHAGATKTIVDNSPEPTNAEEFSQLVFESPTPITWEIYCEKRVEYLRERALKQIRAIRDDLLLKSDFITNPVMWDTIQNKDDWLNYRQALRDLPATITEYKWTRIYQLDYKTMSFPEKPPIIRITSQPTPLPPSTEQQSSSGN